MTSRFAVSTSPEQVRQLFNPRSVALIGATDKSRWSWSIFGNLQLHGFAGPVYLVNPRGIPVHGQPSYTSVAGLPGPVDLAFVMVPTSAVLGVLAEVAEAGIPSVVLLTSGFAEVGEEGAELERQVTELARRRGLTVLGPNGNGFVNAAAGITPYGLAIDLPLLRGPVGVVLQSGALASAVLTFAQSRNVGTSLLVSMGNESMVSMTDVMRYLIDDEATRVIALFVESVRRPDEFLALAREALAQGKPVVALKVGRSQTGAKVARAHTGSLVGDDAVVDAVFRQNGVIRVDSLEDLIITAGLLAGVLASSGGPLPGARFGFVTASGGASEIIADRAEDEGIEIPEFAPETVERLRQVVPPFGAVQNPVDVTGYILVNRDLLRNALAAVHDDPHLDALVLVSDLPRTAPPDPAPVIDLYRQTSELLRAATKPVIVMGSTLTDITAFGREVARQTGYPGVLGGIHHGLIALGRAVRWSEVYRTAQKTASRKTARPETVPGPVPGLTVPPVPDRDQLVPGHLPDRDHLLRVLPARLPRLLAQQLQRAAGDLLGRRHRRAAALRLPVGQADGPQALHAARLGDRDRGRQLADERAPGSQLRRDGGHPEPAVGRAGLLLRSLAGQLHRDAGVLQPGADRHRQLAPRLRHPAGRRARRHHPRARHRQPAGDGLRLARLVLRVHRHRGGVHPVHLHHVRPLEPAPGAGRVPGPPGTGGGGDRPAGDGRAV
ncbi:MAG TPA: CoA-binding protein [Trebonia sp.]